MINKLPTQPYKGARDFYPKEMRIRNYIFGIWRKVCKSYGYEEYDGPFLENYEIYAAKSGEEIVKEQLYSFIDRGDRQVAIRPEMTPTLARMVSSEYKTLTKPIRWFSIPNLWRYEKPQKGRLREHYQLNVDIFGLDGFRSDFEVISVVIDVFKAFGADKSMFKIKVNNRRLMNDIYNFMGFSKDQAEKTNRILDKRSKMSESDFLNLLKLDAKLSENNISSLMDFLENPDKYLDQFAGKSEGADEVRGLMELVKIAKNQDFVKYDPTIIRGLDYYTGNVFEVFDLNENNNRALCGGGRYDNLVELFIDEKLPGTGFGMGDVTMKSFLEEWDLIPNFQSDVEYFVSLWPEDNPRFLSISLEVASLLRAKGKNVVLWLEHGTKMDKQLKFADKRNAKFTVIIGTSELENNTLTIKNMQNEQQSTQSINDFLNSL